MGSTCAGRVRWRGWSADSCSLKLAVVRVAVALIIPGHRVESRASMGRRRQTAKHPRRFRQSRPCLIRLSRPGRIVHRTLLSVHTRRAGSADHTPSAKQPDADDTNRGPPLTRPAADPQRRPSRRGPPPCGRCRSRCLVLRSTNNGTRSRIGLRSKSGRARRQPVDGLGEVATSRRRADGALAGRLPHRMNTTAVTCGFIV